MSQVFTKLRDKLLAGDIGPLEFGESEFNWALDYFDDIPGDRPALGIVSDRKDFEYFTFGDLKERSNRVANYLRALGLVRGDRLIILVGNVVELWESVLGAMKLGVVLVPCSTLLNRAEIQERIERTQAKGIVAEVALIEKCPPNALPSIRIAVGDGVPEEWVGFRGYERMPKDFEPEGSTSAQDPLLMYFTSGTTSRPKIVVHTHTSYPVGHLSTMYWVGLRPGDVHLNISSPGWAKHAWSSFFAPWSAEATILVYNYERFDANGLFEILGRCKVTTFCAPPTVWRMLIQADLRAPDLIMRELVSAGEPLNPEVIARVRDAWGLTIRDGYGQTETTAQIANPPGFDITEGSMGRPLPGYTVVLLDTDGLPTDEGEICLDLTERPVGLMSGYLDEDGTVKDPSYAGHYHTGDVARRDDSGMITYVGRVDDVFKSSDYRISPFELESALLEHPAIAEVAVVPSPDPLRLSVPKAFIALAAGYSATEEVASSIFKFGRIRLPPFKRIRLLEFRELPKTTSGKIRRVELRVEELDRDKEAPHTEYREAQFGGDSQ